MAGADGKSLPKRLYYEKIKDWYLDGDWTQKMEGFSYGVNRTLFEQGYFLDNY